MPKYTYIIPVYKAEDYLDECLSSILKQTYSDYEILLVDDESPDNSGAMCDAYAQKYDFIRVIHQKNGGASVARNTGIQNAAGEYVIFLDSDDFWDDAEGLRKIDALFQPGVDAVGFASRTFYFESGNSVDDRYNYPPELNSMLPEESLKYMVEHDLLNMHSSKKAFRKAFLIDNGLFYKPGIRTEDVEWGLRIANCLPTYRFLNEKLYVYRQHSGSVTKVIGAKHLEEYLGIIRKFVDYTYCNETVKSALLSYVAYQYSLLLAYTTLLKPANKDELLKELKNYQFLYRYTSYPRTKMISTAHRFLGFHGTRFFLALYLRRSYHN